MPKYHLNVFNDVEAPDEEGIDRPNLEIAKAEAIAGARDLVATQIRSGEPVYRSHRIEITDPAGVVLHTVAFGDIIDLRP